MLIEIKLIFNFNTNLNKQFMKIKLENIQKFLERNFKTKKFNYVFRSWDNSYSIRKSNQSKVIAYYFVDSQELIFNK